MHIPNNVRNKSIGLLDSFEEFERNIFNHSIFNEVHNKMVNSFRTDIIDKGNSYELKAELPGFQKADIDLRLDDNYLTICAVHREETNESKDNYIRKERRFGTYKRCFNVSDINVETITAQYKNGILDIMLPKKTSQIPNRKNIEIQ